jgi:hypothetical protein
MIPVRRLTLQLTPLLDLMLIVLFAQYMEVKIVAQKEAERIANERRATDDENESLRKQVDEWETAQRQKDQTEQREREKIGQLVRELFRVPESMLNKFIQPRSKTEAGGLSPGEISDLKARLQQLASSTGEQIVDHLLMFNEMRKQFDIWDVYMTEEGELRITAGPDRQTLKTKPIETPEAFVDAILKVRKQFPPTKDTVLILCRYGDCRLINKLSMVRGLPAIAERLRQDGQGTTNFEYAVFGYRPQPELEAK